MTRDEWVLEGKTLFGQDKMQWKFKCPSCKYIATVADYKNAGALESAVGFSCVGRWLSQFAIRNSQFAIITMYLKFKNSILLFILIVSLIARRISGSSII